MATKEAVFSLRVETGNSVQDVQNFDKAVSNLNKDIKQVQQTAQQGTGIDTFDAKLQELNARVEAGGLTMRELTQTMKAYQTIAAQAGMESPVGQQAIQAAGQLKDQIGDLKAATTALSSDFVGLDTAVAGIETGAAIFQGFQSAIALTGVENEKLVQTMVKLQAVQGVVNAVNTVAKNLNSDAILGIQLRTYWEKLYTVAVGESTGALKLFRIALLSTGIGAVIVGITALIANFDSLKEMITGVTAEEQKLADQRKKNQKAQAEFISKESQGFATLIAQLQASNEGSKERSRLIDQINKQYGTTLKNLSDEAAFQNQLNRELENYLAFQKAKFQLQASEELIVANLRRQSELKQQLAQDEKRLLEAQKDKTIAFQEEKKASDQLFSDETFDRTRTFSSEIERLKKRINENTTELEKAETRFENYGKSALKANQDIFTLSEGDTKYTETAIKNREKLADQAKKNWEEDKKRGEKSIELGKTILEEIAKIREEREAKITNIIRQNTVTRQELAEREAAFIERLRSKEFRDAQGYLIAQITQDETNWEARQALLNSQKAQELANKELTEGEILAIEAKYAKLSEELQMQKINKMIENAQYIKDQVGAIFQVITDFENIRLQELENNTQNELAMLDQKYQQDLNSSTLTAEQKAALDKNYAAAKYATELKLFNETEKIKEKQFKRDKALRIAQAGIDTAAAIVKAIQMFGPPPSPAGIAGIAAAVGIGLAQIAAIASTKYQAGTAPSISGGGTGISAGATGSELGGAAVNGSLAGQQMSTAELVSQTNQGNVYVLESDITGTQNKVATQNKLSVW